MTGGIWLLQLPTERVAIKEAMVPGIIWLVLLGSLYTGHNLVEKMFLGMLDADKIFAKLENTKILKVQWEENKNLSANFLQSKLDKKSIQSQEISKMHLWTDGIRRLTRWIIASFALSTTLNYLLATWIVTSPSGTQAFNEEIGRLTGLSFPAIALPATIIMTVALTMFLMKLHKETGLEFEEMIKQ